MVSGFTWLRKETTKGIWFCYCMASLRLRHGSRGVTRSISCRAMATTWSLQISEATVSVNHLVAEVIGLLDHYDTAQAFVAGHDWGGIIGWSLCLFRPERVKGFICLSSRSKLKPSEFFKRYGDGLYISQFQKPGRTEASFAKHGCLTVMKQLLLTTRTDLLVAPPGTEIIDDLEILSKLPGWITEEELQVYADKFQSSGFSGPLNYYRAMDLNWEILAPWQGSKILVPTKFVAGDKDFGNEGPRPTLEYVKGEMFKSLVPNLEIALIEDGHHFIQQEKSKQISGKMLSFLNKFSTPD